MGGSGNVATEGWGETIWQFHYTRPENALLEIQRERGSKQYRCIYFTGREETYRLHQSGLTEKAATY